VDLYFKWDGNVGLGLPGYISPESGCVSLVYVCPPASCDRRTRYSPAC